MSPDANRLRILVVEDNPQDARLVQRLLAEAAGADPAAFAHDLVFADRLSAATTRVLDTRCDAILLDLSLPDVRGIEAVRAMRYAAPGVPIVLMCALTEEALAVRALQEGAQDYLVKGYADGRWIIRAVRYAQERAQALESLRESQRFLQSTLDALAAAIAILDEAGRIVAVNAAWRRSAGVNPLLGGDCAVGDDYLSACEVAGESGPALVHGMREVAGERRAEFQLEYPSNGAHGGRWFLATVTRFTPPGPLRIVVAHTDISARKRAEAESQQHLAALAHVSRLTTVGNMAAQLAHEVNQPLAAIAGYAEGCIRRLRGAESRELLPALEQIQAQAERAGGIIQRLRNFVRRGEPQRDWIDLNELVRHAATLLGRDALEHGVSVRLDLARDLPRVQGDGIQIQQAVLNLLRNGLEAIAESGTGRGELAVQTEASDGDVIEVVIRDTGAGLPPDVAERMFDAFYTTKAGGLGIGLSITRSIVEAHGGRIRAEANAEGGTTFRFTVPIPPAEPS